MNVPAFLVEALHGGPGAPPHGSETVDLLPRLVGKERLRVAWIPMWYASDQPLLGGIWCGYHFYARGPARLWSALEASGFDGILYSGLGSGEPRELVQFEGRIERILHPKLGELRGLTWGHNLWQVTLGDGSCLLLDDEEGAGHCGRADIEPQDWCLAATMTVNVEAVKSAVLECRRWPF
jgi:hypothetical protein